MGKDMETNQKTRKKKGRPSLLDIQKRNLKLQQKNIQNPNSISHLRSTPLNPNISRESELREHKKLKLLQNCDPSVKDEKVSKVTVTPQGSILYAVPTTPLPDKKLLVFVLDRLQKKDTYGVFSEPVDSKELPDYHEIIKRPMDFETMRKKIDSGKYSALEEFEADVFLLCSNAMEYNSPDTIYFRQARAIQELARKDFENLRHESEESDPEPNVVSRDRPRKHFNKRIGGSPSEHVGPDFDAAPASGEHNSLYGNSYNFRKAPISSKIRATESPPVRASYKSQNGFSVSLFKGSSSKSGKKLFNLDENRRDTYNHCLPSTFNNESQLTVVGLHTEHGYARSLSRFAADLGPAIWEIASKKLQSIHFLCENESHGGQDVAETRPPLNGNENVAEAKGLSAMGPSNMTRFESECTKSGRILPWKGFLPQDKQNMFPSQNAVNVKTQVPGTLNSSSLPDLALQL